MTRMTENEAGSNAPWAQPRTSGGDGKSSLLFWAAMLVLGLFAWGGVTLGASSLLAKKGPEKLLRVELHLPKLNFSQGIRKAIPNHTSEPKSSAQAKPTTDLSKVKSLEAPKRVETKISTVEPPQLSPGAWLNPVAPPAPIAMETCQDPVVYLQPCSVQPGDSPMIRNWKTVSMYSLLVAAASLAPPPVVVQAQEDKGIVDKTGALQKLQKSVDALIERIDKLEKKPVTDKDAIAEVFRAELKKLEDGALDDIRKDMKKIRGDLSTVQAEQIRQKRDIDDLNTQLDSLRKKMLAAGSAPMQTPAIDKAFMEEFHSSMRALKDAIARLGPTKERTSAYPNGATATTGQVVLVNMYNEDLLFILNGNGYSVPANSSKIVQAVPTGALSYQVHSERWGTLGNRLTSLAAGDTFTVTAR